MGKWITTKNVGEWDASDEAESYQTGLSEVFKSSETSSASRRQQQRNEVKEIVQSALSPAETGAAANDSAQVIMVLKTSLRSALLRTAAAEK